MPEKHYRIEVVTDLANAPGWIEMTREYLSIAVARHKTATGQSVDVEEQMRQTTTKIGAFLDPEGRFVVAKDANGNLAGMVLLHRLASGKGEIKRLYVRPSARGTGLARRLVTALEDEARSLGMPALYLDTSPGLHEAIQLYRSLGFSECEFDDASVQDPDVAKHLVFMQKQL